MDADQSAVVVCHQRRIRERLARSRPHPLQTTLDGSTVVQIDRKEAERIILAYEWLGTMPSILRASYGLYSAEGELAGAVCFGQGGGTEAGKICGEAWVKRTICLERGACAHWAHPHAGSFLIARACAAAARDFGWRVFYAYSDESAGEIGTLYQACNWLYLGHSLGRSSPYRSAYIAPDGRRISSRAWRALRRREGVTPEHLFRLGWQRIRVPDKHKYVGFYGPRNDRKRAERDCRYLPLPYPRRA